MQANINYAKRSSGISALALILILVFGVIGSVGIANLNQKLEGFDVDEQAIADAIVAGIVIPDMPEIDTGKLDELWEGVYEGKIEELENASFVAGMIQFLEDNNYPEKEIDKLSTVEGCDVLLGYLEEQAETNSSNSILFFGEKDDLYEFLEGEYEDIESVQFIKEYENDREFNVINLGLDDEDDREVELSGVIKVLVTYDDGNEEYKDKVYINSVVTSDDGELEAEVTYSLSN